MSDPVSTEIAIEKFALKGYGVGSLPGGVSLEVAHSVPGDVVRVEWRKKRHSPQKGRLLEVLKPSPARVEPRCAHVGVCGGCCWQQVDYSAQLKEKQRRVEEAFGPSVSVAPILPAKETFGYRNKMEFSFSENRGGQKYLGLMIAQAEPYVFSLSECFLGPPWFADVVQAVFAWWSASSLSAYFPPKDTGLLRYLTLRAGMRTGQKMAILNVSGNPEFAPKREDLDAFAAAVRSALPEGDEISLFLRIHQTKKGRPTQFYEMHLLGPDHIVEKLVLSTGALEVKISPASFSQPNPLQAEVLYDTALAPVSKEGDLLDLYCGTGTLSLASARKAAHVAGVELSPEAILDAEENAKRNGIENVSFYQGDVGAILGKEALKAKTVIVDPPRAGLDEKAISALLGFLPEKIVYISCNPATQALNIREFLKNGYRLEAPLQPVDQFPHTYHIENIAWLAR